MKAGDTIEIAMYSGDILEAVVSSVFKDGVSKMVRARSGDLVVTVNESQCSLKETKPVRKKD